MKAIESGANGIFFLDASGGTGKTFLLNLKLSKAISNGYVALDVASCGIASTLLQESRTGHSTFKLPMDTARNETPDCNISKGTGMAQMLQHAKLIVWDECTMAYNASLEVLDHMHRPQLKQQINGRRLLIVGWRFSSNTSDNTTRNTSRRTYGVHKRIMFMVPHKGSPAFH